VVDVRRAHCPSLSKWPLALVAALAVVSLVLSPAALGATVRMVSRTLSEGGVTFVGRAVVYEAADGEANELSLSRRAGLNVMQDRAQ
jgi:hypothetical protein